MSNRRITVLAEDVLKALRGPGESACALASYWRNHLGSVSDSLREDADPMEGWWIRLRTPGKLGQLDPALSHERTHDLQRRHLTVVPHRRRACPGHEFEGQPRERVTLDILLQLIPFGFSALRPSRLQSLDRFSLSRESKEKHVPIPDLAEEPSQLPKVPAQCLLVTQQRSERLEI